MFLIILQMKKRAQPPDSHTYTMILRGLAQHTHYPLALSRALSVYQSMFAETSPVRPSIIHTNAMLKVCSRADDLDCLFGIAAKLPTKGNGAPNNLTYTTILNAIRTNVWSSSVSTAETDEEKLARRQRGVLQGRRIWGDIIERWRKGDIRIDEELVCSMGRLLLVGFRTNDFDDVLSLAEQTMNIRRQTPRLGDPARTTHLTSILSEDSDISNPDSIDSNQPVQEAEDLNSSISSQSPSSRRPEAATPSPGSEFDPLPLSSKNVHSFARPGRNTLSLLIDACIRMRLPKCANTYRSLLTSPSGEYKVTPDTENLHMYLRLLRQTRSSSNSAKVVNQMLSDPPPGPGVQAKTFRIAMSTCVRDKLNPAVGVTATSLLRMMEKSLEEPDLRTCEMFLEVIQSVGEKNWRETLSGLAELDSIVKNWRSLLAFGRFTDSDMNAREDEDEEPDEEDDNNDEDVERGVGKGPIKKTQRKNLAIRTWDEGSHGVIDKKSRGLINHFVRSMISVYDKLLFRARQEMTVQEREKCMRTRSELAAWVTKQANKNRWRNNREGEGEGEGEGDWEVEVIVKGGLRVKSRASRPRKE